MITRKQFLASIGAVIAAPFVAVKVYARERMPMYQIPSNIRKYPLTEKECFRVFIPDRVERLKDGTHELHFQDKPDIECSNILIDEFRQLYHVYTVKKNSIIVSKNGGNIGSRFAVVLAYRGEY